MKYIIDIPDDTSYVNVVKVIEGDVANVKTLRLAEMEKCDPDQMQQDSYFLGVEDGRKLGQDEAWDFAKKVRFADFVDDERVLRGYIDFFDTYQEAKEKFDSYIESQREIEVGNEVICEESGNPYDGTRGYVGHIYEGNTFMCGYALIISKSGIYSLKKECLRKTGNHNSKLAEAIKEITG